MCLGHESSGVIAKLGPDVKPGLKVGDRVALEPGESCRACSACKSGSYELCPDMKFAATPPSIYGTLARYYVLPADLCHPIPDSVSFEDGAMMEPLSVGVHSVSTLGGLKSNQNVVIFGCGPIGLLCMAVAKALGARRIIAVDINQERLEFAKSYAATDIFTSVGLLKSMPCSETNDSQQPPRNKDEDSDAYAARAAEALRTSLDIPALGPGSIDLAVEATGAPSCTSMSMHLLKPA